MAPQDTYVEEEDELCPLCIEEFDLQDRFFKPCPCGYQICQFCFNNIRNNVNGLCPACRRPYDEKTIEWRTPSAEETAEYEARKQNNNKKRLVDQRQKETQKREQEKDSRKNLVGVRVVQKNLVYVTGLTPTVREDELLRTLRKPEFFGQYGNIQKISISNRKSTDGHNQSLGIYVTFEKKEDAARCIQAVNGSQNGERILRAQLGTTKYCSAWLRHEQCNNRQCMFLHELGDEEDSYSRQDLSSMNSMNSLGNQRTVVNAGSSRSASRQQAHAPTPQQTAQPMARTSSKDGSENGDGPALPSTANWARNPQVRSRRGSHATSGAAPSPAISNSVPNTSESVQEVIEETQEEETVVGPSTETKTRNIYNPWIHDIRKPSDPDEILRNILRSFAKFELPVLPDPGDHFPLFDPRGGEKRLALRQREEQEAARLAAEELRDAQEASEDEPSRSGSRALGGEPEDRAPGPTSQHFDRRGSQPPIQRGNNDNSSFPSSIGFSQASAAMGSIGSRTITPQQQGLMRPQAGFVDNLPPGLASQANPFGSQGHVRQGSRYNFANENRDAASTAIKLAANPRVMAQQASMMPQAFYSQTAGQYHGSSIPGPPPGIKPTGTPPNLLGQHGFGSAFGGMSKESDQLLSILNSRGRATGAQGHDAGKLDLADPSIIQARMTHQQQSNAGVGQAFGPQSQDDELPSLDETTNQVDALVSDDPIESTIGQLPGGFETFGSMVTPAIPPGLFNPAHPSPSISQVSLHGGSKGRQTPPAAAFYDSTTVKADVVIPTGPSIGNPSKKLSGPPGLDAVRPTTSGFEAKRSIKALAIESGLSKDIASQASNPKVQKLLDEEDFPALDSPRLPSSSGPTAAATAKAPSAPKKASISDKKTPEQIAERAAAKMLAREAKAAEKRAKAARTAAAADSAGESSKAAQSSHEPNKKPTPGILNIAAATSSVAKTTAQNKATDTTPTTTEKSATADKDAFPVLPTPSTASVSSPLARTAPKTLRVVPTPKTEVPPALSAASTNVMSGGAPLRSAALAAVAGRPETPASEIISDSASIISASVSISRTSSPPPTRVGTAPVRTTTKSQQRKQRKEASRREAADIAPTTVEPEAEIAPILGRKKKQKKEKGKGKEIAKDEDHEDETEKDQPDEKAADKVHQRSQDKGKGKVIEKEPEQLKEATPKKDRKGKGKEKEAVASTQATPTPSRPQTPVVEQISQSVSSVKKDKGKEAAKEPVKEPIKEESSTYRSTANETTNVLDHKAGLGKIGAENIDTKTASAGMSQSSSTDADLKSQISPKALFESLRRDGLLPNEPENLAFFKFVDSQGDSKRLNAQLHAYWKAVNDGQAPAPVPMSKTPMTEEEGRKLLKGEPVRKLLQGSRLLTTPNFDALPNLTEEEENEFMRLQKRLEGWEKDPATFNIERYAETGGFSLVKGRAVPNGAPSWLPREFAMSSSSSHGEVMDKIAAKLQRQEAIHYINQWVLPRVNTTSDPAHWPVPWKEWKEQDPAAHHHHHHHPLTDAAYDAASDAAAPELQFPTSVDDHHHLAASQPGMLPSMLDTSWLSPAWDGVAQPGASLDAVIPGSSSHAGGYPASSSSGALNAFTDILGPSNSSGVGAESGPVVGPSTGLSMAGTVMATAPGHGPFGGAPLMGVEEAKEAADRSRKESEKIEKTLNALIKKNRRLLLGS